MGVQADYAPEQKVAIVQTEPLNDEHSCTSEDDGISINVVSQSELQGSRSALLHDEMFELPPVDSVVTQPSSTLTTILPSVHFDWAEDAELLPIASKLQPRDLSVLRSNIPQPFDSIQRQARRRQTHNFLPSLFVRRGRPVWTTGPIVTHRHPFGLGSGKPIISIPSPVPQESPLKLDWDSDPRLVDLSQALCALGWAPTC
jgi:hypothetical protein